MKKRANLILGIIIFFIGIIIIYTYYKSSIETGSTEENTQFFISYYCGGTYCLKEPNIAGSAISYSNCEVCNQEMEFPDTNVDVLCSTCSGKTRRCKYCGEQLTDEMIAQNKLKQSHVSKYNKINLADSKVAYIDGTNYIACLCDNYDEDKEINPNKIVILDMTDYSVVKTIRLNKDYNLEYQYNYDFMGKDIDTDEMFQFLKNEEIAKENYEKLGRMFYYEEKLILINPEKEKNFIYDLEDEQFINEMDFKIDKYKEKECYILKDLKEDISYYYFEEYDLITTSTENIEWSNYLFDPYKFMSLDYYDAQIIYQDKEQILISYYEQEYGTVKLRLFSKDGKNIDLSKLNKNFTMNDSQITICSKNMIICYDIIEECEVWSYDKNLKNKIYDKSF